MAESILRNESKDFAKRIILLCKDIKSTTKETVLTNQLLRSGTSIGANIYEAQYAQGKKDFISKLEIAQKECFDGVLRPSELADSSLEEGVQRECSEGGFALPR